MKPAQKKWINNNTSICNSSNSRIYYNSNTSNSKVRRHGMHPGLCMFSEMP